MAKTGSRLDFCAFHLCLETRRLCFCARLLGLAFGYKRTSFCSCRFYSSKSFTHFCLYPHICSRTSNHRRKLFCRISELSLFLSASFSPSSRLLERLRLRTSLVVLE